MSDEPAVYLFSDVFPHESVPIDSGTVDQNVHSELLFQRAAEDFKLRKQENEERRREEEHSKRFEIERRIWHLTCWYLGIVGFMVFLEGASGTSFLWLKFTWHLSETIIVTVLTTTMATVLGLILIIIKYFFKNSDKENK